MESELAKLAEQRLIEAARRMTREQRLAAYVEHYRRVYQLYAAGERLRAAAVSKETKP